MNDEQGTGPLVIPEAIRTLLEQRAQYMEWLGKLDDLGDRYRAEVAGRVRADYRDRLSGVEEELQGHQAELESSLSDRQARLADLEERHDICAAELEEVELRHQVGEFDDEEWGRRKSEHEQELEGIVQELETERDAVAELGSVLVQVTAPSEAAATRHVEPGAWGEPAAADVRAAEREETAWEEDEGQEDEEPVREEEPREPEPTWEAEATGDPSPEPDPAEAAIEEEPSDAAERDEFLDELEFLESLSLDDPESFDAVSRMLEEEGEAAEEEEADRGGAG